MWQSTSIILHGMEPTSPNGGLKGSIMNNALALLPMNGTVTPAWRSISQLETAASNLTNQGGSTVDTMVVTRSTGKSLIATARMLKIDLELIRI